MKGNSFLTRLTQWEHWPTFMFYTPLVPFFIYKLIKAKSPVYFLATNPGILFSGSGSESKFKTLLMVPEKCRPKSVLIVKELPRKIIIENLRKENISFPIIAKPDIGFRGYLVKKIDTIQELETYLSKIKTDIIVQEFITYKNEIGVFYHRIPGENKGKITSITIKKYLSITGNGINTLSELISSHERAFLYNDILKNIHKENMGIVIPNGEIKILSFIGNHSKGTQFLNGNHLINKDLENVIDVLNHQIKGWYYGRIDMKYKNWSNLLVGENFKVIEVNGIISEPTHIYDATGEASYFDAIKTIKSHWEIIDKIALKNHHDFNVKYPSLTMFIKNMISLRTHAKMLKKMNKN